MVMSRGRPGLGGKRGSKTGGGEEREEEKEEEDKAGRRFNLIVNMIPSLLFSYFSTICLLPDFSVPKSSLNSCRND